jgi:hypothetical protein
MIPAPIVPMPARKNGIATWIVVSHHFSCLIPTSCCSLFSSPAESLAAPLSEPKEVVVIELKEPVVEGGKTDNLSSSPVRVVRRKCNICKHYHIYFVMKCTSNISTTNSTCSFCRTIFVDSCNLNYSFITF